MNCSKAHQTIIHGESSAELDAHLSSCSACRELAEKVEATMSLLDETVEVPEGFSDKVIAGIKPRDFSRFKVLNLMSIVQIAAAVAFGIFIGHKFGKNADLHSFKTSRDPIDKYIEAHHLDFWDDAFKLQSIDHKRK